MAARFVETDEDFIEKLRACLHGVGDPVLVAQKGLHRADIVRECNSLKHFALYVINK